MAFPLPPHALAVSPVFRMLKIPPVMEAESCVCPLGTKTPRRLCGEVYDPDMVELALGTVTEKTFCLHLEGFGDVRFELVWKV